MSLISLEFTVFFIIVMIVYFMLPGRLQWMWLLIAGGVFYYFTASPVQCVVFVLFLILNYAASLRITEDSKKPGRVIRLILTFDVLMLMGLRYTDFFYGIYRWLGGLFGHQINENIYMKIIYYSDALCPPRISYFSLIVMGYLTDVYWGRIPLQKNPGKFALFASYFPLMTSGPIVQYSQVSGSLWDRKHDFSYDRFILGAQRVLWGIFKKLVISERLAVMVNEIYDHYELYPGFYILFGAACFAFQLYTDFSGLMDIVLGFSQILDIPLPENFNTPFCSVSLSEFWRRWHITLGAWLRSYVFYAIQETELLRRFRKFCTRRLGRKKIKKYNFPQYLALLISWFLIGLWHGGGWNYIFGVGVYMGIIIIISELCQPLFARLTEILHIKTECFSYTLFRRIRTSLLFIFGLSFFRADTLRYGFSMWRCAFSIFNPWIFFDKSLYSLGLNESEFHILMFSMLILLAVSMLQQKYGGAGQPEPGDPCPQTGHVRSLIGGQNFLFRLILFVVLFIMIICWGYYGTSFDSSDFIYVKF